MFDCVVVNGFRCSKEASLLQCTVLTWFVWQLLRRSVAPFKIPLPALLLFVSFLKKKVHSAPLFFSLHLPPSKMIPSKVKRLPLRISLVFTIEKKKVFFKAKTKKTFHFAENKRGIYSEYEWYAQGGCIKTKKKKGSKLFS